MEIERKFLIDRIPFLLEGYVRRKIEQAYLCTEPVVRVRRDNDDYYLTYKSKGLIAREEYNLPLTAEAYSHLLAKHDGLIIAKTRYEIPEKDGLTIELDVFEGAYDGLILAEVEFRSQEQALAYTPPEWFGEDVSNSPEYHNSTLSCKNTLRVYHDAPKAAQNQGNTLRAYHDAQIAAQNQGKE